MNSVSIIMATYNGSTYISEQLHSILDQTYRDFEIIIIDDCSQDSTVEIIKAIFHERGIFNYNIEVNESNIGVTKSFEKGIAKSKGKYIAISDQDDIWFRRKLEVSLNYVKKYNPDIVHSLSFVMKGNNKTSSIYPKYRDFKKPFGMLMHNNARGATILATTDFIGRILPFSDYDLYDKWIYFLGILYGKVICIDTPLQYYRIHEGNYIGDKFKFRSQKNLMQILSSRTLFYKQLLAFVQDHKKVNAIFEHDRILKEIREIIEFHRVTLKCLGNRNVIKCFFKYIQNVLGNEFTSTERMIYIYYYLLKSK